MQALPILCVFVGGQFMLVVLAQPLKAVARGMHNYGVSTGTHIHIGSAVPGMIPGTWRQATETVHRYRQPHIRHRYRLGFEYSQLANQAVRAQTYLGRRHVQALLSGCRAT